MWILRMKFRPGPVRILTLPRSHKPIHDFVSLPNKHYNLLNDRLRFPCSLLTALVALV